MNCPACPVVEVPDDRQTCPGCGTNLMPLRRIQDLAATLFNEALELVKIGSYELAAAKLAACLAIAEGFPQARRLLGKVLYRAGRREAAVEQWRLALKETPADAELPELLAAAESDMKLGVFNRLLVFVAVLAAGLLAMAVAVRLGSPGPDPRVERLELRVRELSERLDLMAHPTGGLR